MCPTTAHLCSIDEARRDAHRIEIMKSALQAKKRYLIASGGDAVAGPADHEGEDAGDDSWDAAPAPAPAPAPVAYRAPAPAPAVAAPPPPPAPAATAAHASSSSDDRDDDAWGSDDEGGTGAGNEAGASEDEHGKLPAGWTVHADEEGDKWYYNAATGATSWVRPNPDGSVPAS